MIPMLRSRCLASRKEGQFAFEEFCVARLALHVKIYLHQKVRAAEAQLCQYLTTLAQGPVLRCVHNWLRVPESIIEYPEIISQRFRQTEVCSINSIPDRSSRDYSKRSTGGISCNVHLPLDPSIALRRKYKRNGNIAKSFDAYFDIYRVHDLKQRIIDEAIVLCDENRIELDQGLLDDIIIEIPRLINIQQGQETLFFEKGQLSACPMDDPHRQDHHLFPGEPGPAYIFAPREIASVICVASEKVIFDISGKVYSQRAIYPSPSI